MAIYTIVGDWLDDAWNAITGGSSDAADSIGDAVSSAASDAWNAAVQYANDHQDDVTKEAVAAATAAGTALGGPLAGAAAGSLAGMAVGAAYGNQQATAQHAATAPATHPALVNIAHRAVLSAHLNQQAASLTAQAMGGHDGAKAALATLATAAGQGDPVAQQAVATAVAVAPVIQSGYAGALGMMAGWG